MLPPLLYIGNFNVHYSTENHRAQAFERCGHRVIKVQENTATVSQIRSRLHLVRAVFYTHTHTWSMPGIKNLIAECKQRGIPTASIHLDRWVGLDRQADMHTEATWDCDYIFMADWSAEAQQAYIRLGSNAYYSPPGVVESECKFVKPNRNRYPHDVIFVGSKKYHPEHPFRPQLIQWLQDTYGARFGHYGNDGKGVVRGLALNTLYASAKVVVGDSFDGGRVGYVSDRLTETVGRGGFLIQPDIDTLGIEGLVTYTYPNLDDLKSKIDFYLENPAQRDDIRQHTFNQVRTKHTYTHRARAILDIMHL